MSKEINRRNKFFKKEITFTKFPITTFNLVNRNTGELFRRPDETLNYAEKTNSDRLYVYYNLFDVRERLVYQYIRDPQTQQLKRILVIKKYGISRLEWINKDFYDESKSDETYSSFVYEKNVHGESINPYRVSRKNHRFLDEGFLDEM